MGNMDQGTMKKVYDRMASTFKQEFTISSYDLDPRGGARLTTLANFFQEIAYHHANELGFGYVDMKNRDTMWVLSRMKIRIERYPLWDDRIMVETWPSGTDKLFAIRDFRIHGVSGDVLGFATSYWLIVNMESHRPLRPKAELDRYAHIVYGEPVFDSLLEKIERPGPLARLEEHRVMFSDLDIVGHVNNVKYMEWCIDTAINELNDQRQILELEINYIHEALFGEMIDIYGIPDGSRNHDISNPKTYMAIRPSDGAEIFRARITWGPPARIHQGR
jgi:medium-chain acyl-[acyl-carrier-protein] hydrolase